MVGLSMETVLITVIFHLPRTRANVLEQISIDIFSITPGCIFLIQSRIYERVFILNFEKEINKKYFQFNVEYKYF